MRYELRSLKDDEGDTAWLIFDTLENKNVPNDDHAVYNAELMLQEMHRLEAEREMLGED